MNEQLRKAIQEATRVEFVDSHETVICHSDHLASQAKLLRVIELLVQQRNGLLDEFLAISGWKTKEQMDAELIAALEENHESQR